MHWDKHLGVDCHILFIYSSIIDDNDIIHLMAFKTLKKEFILTLLSMNTRPQVNQTEIFQGTETLSNEIKNMHCLCSKTCTQKAY